jgi:hypothetical protein
MAKKAKKITLKKPSTKKINPPTNELLHLDMTFEEAIKLAVNTPIKKSKINKK